MVENFKKLNRTRRESSTDKDEQQSTEHSFSEAFTNINTYIKLDLLDETFNLRRINGDKDENNESDFTFTPIESKDRSFSPDFRCRSNERKASNFNADVRKMTFTSSPSHPLGITYYPAAMHHFQNVNINLINQIPPQIIHRDSDYTTKYDSLE